MKKILALLSSIFVVSASSSLLVSCANNNTSNVDIDSSKSDDLLLENLGDFNLGEINIDKPYKKPKDDNEFNWNHKDIQKKTLGDNWNDFGKADDSIGFYEIANLYFSKVDKLHFLNVHGNKFEWNDTTYKAWYGFHFSLKNVNGNKYTLSVSSYSKKVNVNFSSKTKIQETLDSKIDGTKTILVKDGSKETIISTLANKFKEEYPNNIDWSKLDINNRLFSRRKDQVGYDHTLSIDNKTGVGKIQIFLDGFGGTVDQSIKIDAYKSLHFDYKGNPYYYYDDRTKTQIENLDKINNSENDFDSDKHVIVLGLDGVREDKFISDVLKIEEPSQIPEGYSFKSFYSQPWESVYGWKNLLTGSLSGDSENIFSMVKKRNLSTFANTMWNSFDTRVFTNTDKESGEKNIEESFSLGNYQNLAKDGDGWINKKYSIEAAKDYDKFAENTNGFDKVIEASLKNTINVGEIDDTLPKDELKTDDKMLLDLNSLKTYASYRNFLDNIGNDSNKMPNLSFQYDTLEDNEGHSFSSKAGSYNEYYNSKVYKDTMKAYSFEVEDLFNKYGKDPNNLVIVTTDHGRDNNDSSHQGYDNGPKRAWFYANMNLDNFMTGNNNNFYNQSSLKEIIYNFLSKK